MNEKNIDLCGIGNGLVDVQFEVSNEDFEKLGYHRGEMRLIDISDVPGILGLMGSKNHFKCSGGSAANTIIAFSHFGAKAAYKTSLGNDEFGHFYANEFKKMGIELRASFLNSDPTGVCLVFITPDSERTMLTALGATAKFNVQNLDEDLIRRSEWLYFEGYSFTQKNTTEAIYEALDMGLKYKAKISLSFSDNFIIENFRDDLKALVERSDLIFCNEMEAKSYTLKTNINEAFEELTKICPNVVMTLGAKGSKIRWNGQNHVIEPYVVEPIDSTGAGDMFAGAFFYGIKKWSDAQKAGKLASLASSRVISQFGARLKESHKALVERIDSEK